MADNLYGEVRQFDLDTGGGTDLTEVSGIVFAASGGAVLVGGVLESGASAVGAMAVGGGTPHDAVDSGNPTKVGGYAKAAAPTDVNADGDRVNAWFLRNGAQATVLTAAGALIAGSAANGIYADIRGIGGSAPSATVPLPTRITDGTAYYTKTGQTAGTAAFAQLSDQTTAVSVIAATNALKTDLSSVGGTAVVTGGVAGTQGVGGLAAADAAVAGNPVWIGARASAAIPTAMSADGDAVGIWANRNGAQVIAAAPHVGLNGDPWSLVSKTAKYSSTQTSTVLVTGGASEKIVVTKVQIQAAGTTAGDVQLYFGTGAYSRGTNRAIFDGAFIPSATSGPGVVDTGPWIAGTNGDDLMVTTSAAITVTITVWYYVVV